jgi:hypothetical protein
MFKLAFLFVGFICKSNIAETTRSWEIRLDKSLGVLKIDLPVPYDTLIMWTEYSDCGDPCAQSDYRVQKKSNPVFKDNGFLYFPLKNSVFQFTVKHDKLFEVLNARDTSEMLGQLLLERLRGKSRWLDSDRLSIDTVLLIDGHKFAVIAYSGYDRFLKTNVQEVVSTTMFRGNIIEFYFANRQLKKRDLMPGYIQESITALKTLKLLYGS